ncbi:hypothetical protein [Arthrobacter sp. M4]|nr:hypothetical protein [Arthrobacter sp. M4]
MGTESKTTGDDGLPEIASVLEDILELSLLSIEPGHGPVYFPG